MQWRHFLLGGRNQGADEQPPLEPPRPPPQLTEEEVEEFAKMFPNLDKVFTLCHSAYLEDQ